MRLPSRPTRAACRGATASGPLCALVACAALRLTRQCGSLDCSAFEPSSLIVHLRSCKKAAEGKFEEVEAAKTRRREAAPALAVAAADVLPPTAAQHEGPAAAAATRKRPRTSARAAGSGGASPGPAAASSQEPTSAAPPSAESPAVAAATAAAAAPRESTGAFTPARPTTSRGGPVRIETEAGPAKLIMAPDFEKPPSVTCYLCGRDFGTASITVCLVSRVKRGVLLA